jgi:hypothetical protein
MRGHRLRVLERAAIAEIGGDPGRAKRVISDRRVNAGRNRAPARQASAWDIGASSARRRRSAQPRSSFVDVD